MVIAVLALYIYSSANEEKKNCAQQKRPFCKTHNRETFILFRTCTDLHGRTYIT